MNLQEVYCSSSSLGFVSTGSRAVEAVPAGKSGCSCSLALGLGGSRETERDFRRSSNVTGWKVDEGSGGVAEISARNMS